MQPEVFAVSYILIQFSRIWPRQETSVRLMTEILHQWEESLMRNVFLLRVIYKSQPELISAEQKCEEVSVNEFNLGMQNIDMSSVSSDI